MAKELLETLIDADPDTVWATVGDFGGIDKFFPGVESCRLEGDDRLISMGPMEIRERQYSRDEANKTYTYGIADMPGVEHRATVTVHQAATGPGSRVTWEYEVEPEAMGAVMHDTYTKALEALKAHFA